MADQYELFGDWKAYDEEDDPIQRQFELYHAANPWIYRKLVAEARHLQSRGHVKYGISELIGGIRWHDPSAGVVDPSAEDAGDFKINNNYKALYSRKIMDENPDLAGFFRTRRRRGEE